jgi:hypothetical protein
MAEKPKFRIGDKVIFLDSTLYVVSRQIRGEKYYYGLGEHPEDEAFLSGIPENQLAKAEI